LKNYAIIVAGGSGTRMGSELPKQFIEIKKKPILMHSISAFFNFDKEISIIVVLPESQLNFWEELCKKHAFYIPHTVTSGGKERFNSVKNGLSLIIDKNSLVGIHDGVRPCVSIETLQRCYNTALETGNAIPVVDIVDSIRKVASNGSSTSKNRADYKIVQTPQCFNTSKLKKAYALEYIDSFTDDASVFEAFGESINLVEGNRENIKITTPTDLIIGEAYLT
jgi:2-C-methyl-D-erythritol 4-phosphate cytidylyltransferase